MEAYHVFGSNFPVPGEYIIGGYNTMKNLRSIFGMDVEELDSSYYEDDSEFDFDEPDRKATSSKSSRSSHTTGSYDETKDFIKKTNDNYIGWLRDGVYLLTLAQSDSTDPDIVVQPEFQEWVKELRPILAKAPKSVLVSKKTATSDEFKDLWFMQPKKAK